MSGLSLKLLGSLDATLNDQPLIKFKTRRTLALLAFLSVEKSLGTHIHRRGLLTELLWPGLPPKSGRKSLRTTLYYLRQAVGDIPAADKEQAVPFLLADRSTVRINPAYPLALDVAEFDHLISDTQDRWPQAVALYRGDFLTDFYIADANPFEEWAGSLRAAFRRQVLEALDWLTSDLISHGNFVEAERYGRRQLEIDNLRESAYRQLMRLYALAGRRPEAIALYRESVRIFDEELGIEPSEETHHLYARLSRDEQLSAVVVKEAEQDVVLDLLRTGDVPTEPPAFLTGEEGAKDKEGVFVGRERELSRLHGFLDQSLTGRGRVAFVIGEAGQGKTSLLNEFARRAQLAHPDLVVAAGVCNAYSGVGDAYLPFRDVMGMLTGDIESQWSAGVVTRDHALRLWRLLPTMVKTIVDQGPDLLDIFVSSEALAKRTATFETGEGGGLERLQERLSQLAHTGRQSQDQSHLFGVYTEVLKALARRHPLVLILDDLHWADISSINLLFHLARRVSESQILILGAYRPEDVALGRDDQEHPLKGVLGEFKRHFGDTWVDLDQGEQIESRQFVDALIDTEPNRLGERFRQELAHHTQGHPLFTVELLRDMQERGDLVQDEMGRWKVSPDLGWDTFPAKVEGVVENRIGRLDADQQDALTVASVEGEAFTAEVIARVLRVEEQALVRQLSGEMDKQHRLVYATGIERSGAQRLSRYRFRHNLFQRYLYTNLDEVERAYRHEAVGSELEKLHAGQPEALEAIAGQLARHFHEAGDHGRALKYFIQAGDRAVRLYAYEEARQYLQRALKLSEADKTLFEKRMELLERLGDVHGLLGDNPEAIPLYQEALNLRQSLADGDKWTTIRLHRKIGESWISINIADDFLRFEAQAQASLEAGLELVKSEPPHLETIRLLLTLSRSAQYGGPYAPDWETAENYTQVAVEMAEQLDAPAELSAALGSLVRVYGARGRWRECVQVALRRLKLSREAHFGDLRENLDILTQTGEALMGVGKYARAIPHLMEAEALGDQLQDVRGKTQALVIQGQCWLRLDRWDDILKAKEKLKALQRRHPLERLGLICWLLGYSAAVHALRGERKRATQLAQESYEIMAAVAGLEEGTEEHWIREPEEHWIREQHY